ncbi:DUF3224 domain-containing protein [Aestuariibacter sp. AA17]|uniref:DUF3224 domain-containing protein n=1 Tax=Fluctibacter corallii TaxID=2984329 RepID=A0ABT3A8M7_9ALTE|nr:DUF3224 domain-containing protein [Aestuariibacter sp. AA17]MCV2885044.1 DUF3224 domain-containing protein [Aestuariibacter sp. AA17]
MQGNIKVESWNEELVSELGCGGKVTKARVSQVYSGDLIGESRVEYTMFYDNVGNAEFMGFEVFNGTLQGKECEIIFRHSGQFDSGVVVSQFAIFNVSEATLIEGYRGALKSSGGKQASYIIQK